MQLYRKDRNINGGGVFVLAEESIPSSQTPCDTPCELIWVQLHTSNHQNIILGTFYRSPNSPPSVLDDLSDSVQQIKRQFPNASILLGGEFNIPGIDWPSCSLTCSYLSITLRESLITFAQDFLLEQIITKPIRGINTLDLCFVSHPNCIQHYS